MVIYHHLQEREQNIWILTEILSDKYQSFDYIDHLYRYLKREVNITCNRVTLNRYIRNDTELNSLFKRKKDTVFTERFETAPGVQAQFDLKEKLNLINNKGQETVTYIPTLTLGWSRYNYRKLTIDTKTETLLSFLAESFGNIGGVPGMVKKCVNGLKIGVKRKMLRYIISKSSIYL